MAVTVFPSTLDGGYSVVCDYCGIKMDFDISIYEYEQNEIRWNFYLCPECIKYRKRR